MGLLAQWASLIAQWQRIPTNAGNVSLIPGSEKSSGERNGYPFQYSCLGKPTDRGAWRPVVHWGCEESEMTEGLTLS